MRKKLQVHTLFSPAMVVTWLLLLLANASAYAQLNGVITIPSGNYPSIRSAVDSLNLYGVGPGGVIFNVTAGHTETAPTGGIKLTATGTVANPIIIQKDPATTVPNPLITAQVGTTTNLDGVFFLLGSDYITIDGIDIQESAANTTATTQMEFGFALLNRNATAPFDGCQNNTIRNCSITLNRTNTATRGIYSNHHVSANTTALTLTAAADAHSFNKFYANKIQNCFTGIFINGYDDPTSPFTMKDRGNDVGGNSYATADTITNFGTASAYGIYLFNQSSVNASYNYVNNTMNGGASATGAITGIFVVGSTSLYQDNSSVSSVSFNTVNLSVASGSGLMYCVDVENVDGNLNVSSNTVAWTNLATTTGSMYGIYTGHSAGVIAQGTLNFKNNVAQNFTFANSTATCQIFAIGGATQTTQDISGNIINNITRNAATTAATYLLRSFSTPGGLTSGTVSNIYNNSVTNITINQTGTSSAYGIQATGNYTTNAYNNVVDNINAPTGTVSFFGIFSDNATYLNIYNNSFSTVTATGNMYGILSQVLSGLQGQNIYGNTVSNFTSTGVGTYNVFGFNGSYGALSYNNIYRNKFVGLAQLGGGASAAQGIYIAQGNSATTLAPYAIYNNVVANLRAPLSSATANPGVIGINMFNQSNPYEATLSYNTILLNDTAGANTNSACIYQNAVRRIRLNNNVLINRTYHAPGTGVASVIHRTGTSLASYHSSSNNNMMYAGNMSSRNLIFFDGTNRDSTLLSFKTRIAPREASTSSANVQVYDGFSTPPVLIGSNNYAQQDTTVASILESAGQNIAGVTTDFRGVIRQGNPGYTGTGTRPDIGAFESQGTGVSMSFDSVMVVKNSTNALVGSPNQPIVNIQVYVSGSTGSLTATQFSLSTSGTVNVADLSSAKIFYTGSSPAFNTSTPFGTPVISPSGTFSISGSQTLLPGLNNFWLAYDIAPTAVVGNIVDGLVNNVVVSSISKTSLNGNPAGTKTIAAPLGGVYTVGTAPYVTLASIINDLNTNGINAAVTVNVPAGFTEMAPSGGYVLGSGLLNAAVSAAKTITIRKVGSGANPLLSANAGVSTTLDGIFTLTGIDYVTIDGIDLIDTNLVSATTQMEWGYGLLKLNAVSPFDGCQRNTFKNCTITLKRVNGASRGIYVNNHLTNDATQLNITNDADANSYNRFVSNTIQNVNTGIFISGYAASASLVNYQLYDMNNVVGDSAATGNYIYDFGGLVAGFGINLVNQMNPAIGFNTVDNYNGGLNGAVGATLLATGIMNTYTFTSSYNPTNPRVFNNMVTLTAAQAATGGLTNINVNGSHGDVVIDNNQIKWATLGTGIVSGALIGIYYNLTNGAAYIANSLSVKGNAARDFSFIAGGSTSHTIYYINGAAMSEDISYDTAWNLTRVPHASTAYSGTMTLLFNNTTSNPGLSNISEMVRNIHDNYFVGYANGSTATGGVSGINTGGTYTINIYRNTVSSISNSGAASSNSLGIFCQPASYYNVYDNRIDSIISTVGSTWGINYVNASGLGTNMYRNTISNSAAGTSSLYVAGIFVQSGGRNFSFYNNKIYGLNNTTTGTGYTVGVYYNNVGLAAFNYTPARFYNNVIGNLTASTATTSANPAVMGFGFSVASPSSYATVELYHNTVSLTGTTASNRNSAGIFMGGTTASCIYKMANNIVINNITPSGTGVASVIHRTTTLSLAATIDNGADNNLYWAGVPSAFNVIYFDGTNKDQTMSAYQSRMYPREDVSVRENVTFISTLGNSDYYLQPDTTLNTSASNGGSTVAGITTDFRGTVRSVATPDMGAYEGNYTSVDITPPSITVTPLLNTGSTTATLNLSATIKDISGVANTASGLEPRVYFKKTGGAYVSTSGTLSSGNALNGNWNFAINPSLLGGVVLGDTISYYIAAQDVAGNLISAPIGATGAAVTGISTDPSNPFKLVVTNGLSGNYTVCASGCTFNSLTNVYGAFDSINKSALTGNVTLTVTGDLEGETGSISLGALANNGNFSVQIVPGSASEKLIAGTATTGLIVFNGADNVTIDGRFAGVGNFLRFRNRSTGGTACTVKFMNDAHVDTVRNVIIEGCAPFATIYFTAPLAGGTGNDSNAVIYCDIRDTLGTGLNSSLTINPVQNSAFYSDANFNSNNTIAFNNIYNFIYQGVNIAANLAGNDNWTIHQNSFYQLPSAAAKAGSVGSAATQGIRISSGEGHTITNNSIGGSAPDRSGAAWKAGYLSFGAVSFRGIELQTNLGMNRLTTISGNTISNIDANPLGGSNIFAGILVSSGLVNVTNNTVGGGAMPYDTIKEGSYSTSNVGGIVLVGGIVNASNNTVGNLYNYLDNAGNTAIIRTVGINLVGGGTAPIAFTVTNNTIRDIRSSFYNSPTNMLTYTTSSPVGILVTAAVGVKTTIEGNTIFNIRNTQTSGATGQAAGISLRGGTNIVERNRIYGLSVDVVSTGSDAPAIIGVYNQSTSALGQIIRNNQISLSSSAGNTQIMGIVDATNFATQNDILNNSIYIGGTNVGSANSYGVLTGLLTSLATTNVYNNILYNGRIGGTGNHYAAGSYYNSTSISASSFGYNLMITPSANAVIEMPAGVPMNAAAINGMYGTRSSNSNWIETSANVTAGSLFTNAVNGNLGLVSSNAASWYANGKGLPLATVSKDFTNATRSTSIVTGATDIGSVEVTPSVVPASAVASASPALNTTTTYTFGNRTIATVNWGASGTVPSALDVKYFSGTNAPSLLPSRTQYNAYYSVVPTGGTGYSYNIALAYDSAVTGNVGATSETRMAYYRIATSNWNLVTSSNANGTSGMLSSGASLSAASLPANFTGTNNSNPLPVMLVNVTAKALNGDVNVAWTTATEINNKGFEVERSVDGESFVYVGFMKGAGNSSKMLTYSFKDRAAFAAENSRTLYYRLKQIDLDGNSSYSDIVSVNETDRTNQGVSLYPNPTSDVFTVSAIAGTAGQMTVTILTIEGKVIANYTKAATQGINSMSVDSSALNTTGVYFVKVVMNGEVHVMKLVKQ